MEPSLLLFASVFSFAALKTAWEHVRQNKGCAGVDGETIAHFAEQAETYLSQLEKALIVGTYHSIPLRQFSVPKKEGGWRTLGVPTVRDRIVQQALLNALHPILEPQFEDCSFAYRPGRSHKAAVQQVGYWRDRGYEWVLDGDIVRFFDNLNHDRLFAEFEERVKPADLVPAQTLFSLRSAIFALLEAWIGASILTPEGLVFPVKGVPQGSVVSPILANVYLDDFDEILMAADLKLVRYADDFVVMAKSQPQIIQAQRDVAALLQSMGLQLHPDKTQITNFDRGFRFLGHAFAGDLIVPVQKQQPLALPTEEREEADRLIYADPSVPPTQRQQAMVAVLKAAQQPIPPPLYVVLGYQVRQWKPVTIESNEWEWKTGMSTLYLVKQGTTLRKEQGRFIIEVASKAPAGQRKEEQGSPVEIPIAEVQRVLVFGQVQITTAAITACLEAQIPVVFLSQLGDYKGHLWSAELLDLPAEAMQFQRWQDGNFQLDMAKSLVWGKLLNSKQLLLRLNRKRQLPAVADAILKLDQFVSSAQKTNSLESLRGFEGISAAVYFPSLGKLLTNSGFSLTGRSRRPPTDPVNSLLSFGYTLLFNNVMSLLLAEGLNPYLGNLHRSERKEPHLAFDLMEEFRSPIVDSLIIMLVNKQILKPTDFTWPNAEGGVYLQDPARRVFLKHFEERMSEAVSHPAVQAKVSYRRAIQLQIQHYKSCLLESVSYKPFLRAI
ncbi:MAG: CRISPR-associated endonuclease Cas1 [Stenomitos frigidus ULC029]